MATRVVVARVAMEPVATAMLATSPRARALVAMPVAMRPAVATPPTSRMLVVMAAWAMRETAPVAVARAAMGATRWPVTAMALMAAMAAMVVMAATPRVGTARVVMVATRPRRPRRVAAAGRTSCGCRPVPMMRTSTAVLVMWMAPAREPVMAVSYTHLRAHETDS